MTDNAILAKRIVELDRELSLTKDLLESSMLSEATAKQYAEEVDKQNKALAAQVEALRIAALNAISFMSGGEAKAQLRDAYDATPQQHLAELKAEAGRAGFFKGVAWILDIDVKDISAMVAEDAANQYANKIRQEKK